MEFLADDSFTPWAIFLRADGIVKMVLIMLILMSVASWAIILDRWLLLFRLNRKADHSESEFHKTRAPRQIAVEAEEDSAPDHLVSLAEEAIREWDIAQKQEELKAQAGDSATRVERVLAVEIQRTLSGLERYLSILATIGATAPFVGLFGTVWGIMNSFQSIAVTRETSLAVVAPGIAEALFATAFGLFVAIPAVIFYNWLSNEVARYAGRLDIFANEFWTYLIGGRATMPSHVPQSSTPPDTQIGGGASGQAGSGASGQFNG